MAVAASNSDQVRVVETLAGLNVSIDREIGIIRGVKVIGFESKNGRYYTPEALRNAVGKYEGAKVNIDHPPINDPHRPRSVADRIGVLKNARFQEGAGIYADFHFNPKHHLAEQVAWAAEHDPSAIGFSHNAMVRNVRRPDAPIPTGLTLPTGWTCDLTGVRRAGVLDTILPVPMLITERTEDIADNTESSVITWRDGEHWRLLTVPREILADASKIVGVLARHGIPVNSVNSRDVATYLAAIEAVNRTLIPATRVSHNLG